MVQMIRQTRYRSNYSVERTRSRELDLYSILMNPQIQGLAAELAPVVAEQQFRYPAFALGSIQSISAGFGSMAIRSRLSIDDLAWDNQLNMGS